MQKSRYKFGALWTRKEVRGTKEKRAQDLGFTVTFDGVILRPDGTPARMNYNQQTGYYTFSGPATVLAHRFVFHFWFGPIKPCNVVDHINGNRSDYRIENLREVSISKNNRNRKAGRAWQNLEVNQ